MSAEIKKNYRKAKDITQLTIDALIQHLKYEIVAQGKSINQLCEATDLDYKYTIKLLNRSLPVDKVGYSRLLKIAGFLGYELHYCLSPLPVKKTAAKKA